MKSSDYLPRNDRQFLQWVTNFLNRLSVILARLGFPLEVYDALQALRGDFEQKLDVAEAPSTRTKGSVEAKNDAHKALNSAVRASVQRYLAHNPDVTKQDHDDLGLPIHKTTRTPIPPPTDAVELLLRQLSGNRVEVNFSRVSIDIAEKGGHEAKPFGVRGAEIRWAMLPEPPKSHDDLVHSEFDTRSPYIFQFDLPDAGKT
jgi:uncharacterized glyoxalase superfamily metalloenzyme YdcJ